MKSDRSSWRSSRTDGAPEIWMIFAAALLAGTLLAGCCKPQPVPALECPDPNDELLSEEMLRTLPPEWFDWYWNEYDPWCEALFNARRT